MLHKIVNVCVVLSLLLIAKTNAWGSGPGYINYDQQQYSQSPSSSRYGHQKQHTNPSNRYGQQQHTVGPQRQPLTIGIMMFDNVEVLDVAGPFEVLAIAGEMFGSFKVYMIGTKKTMRAMNGLNIVVDYVIGDRSLPKLDVVVVPGSNENFTNAALNHPAYVPWIKRVAVTAKYIISVCTGVNFLGRAGLVDGLDITTHHLAMELAEQNCPRSKLFRDRRFTDNGRVLTSAGVSAGIDLSLYFVKKIVGAREATAIASRMEYDYKDFDYDKSKGVTPKCRTGCWNTQISKY